MPIDDPGFSEFDDTEEIGPRLPPEFQRFSARERERRAHQCRHDGCASEAKWEVHLHVRYGVRHVAQEHLKSSIRVCDEHRKAAAALITSEHNKKVISTQLATIGRLNIDWPGAIVEYVPIGEESWSPDNMTVLRS